VRRAAAGALLAGLALAGAAPSAAAQDSVFGIRGLGFVELPVSARSAGTGGGYALFDGASVMSPASLAAWVGSVGWAVGAASSRRFEAGSGSTSLSSMRFPVFGFAAPASSHLVLGVTVSAYLNRNWEVVQSDTVTPRDTAVAVSDLTRSTGGISDVRFAAAYRLSSKVAVGMGLHALVGSSAFAVQRRFPGDSVYGTFTEFAQTDFTGASLSLGVFVSPIPTLILGASARLNSRLKAAGQADTVRVHMPAEYHAGVYFAPASGLSLASTIGYATWSAAAGDLMAAGQAPSRDVWSAGVGLEVTRLRRGLPLRVGYRWRELPFPVAGSALSEHAVTAGFGFAAASGRANVDVALELGTRTAGALSERFTTVLIGVSILP
jgi:hypothetical protein